MQGRKRLVARVSRKKKRRIAGKMSKYFKQVIQEANAGGFKMVGYYDTFNNEYVLTIQLPGNTLISIPFSSLAWNPFDSYNLIGTDIINVTNPTDATVSYDSGTGIATYTPATILVQVAGTILFEGS